VRLREEGLEVYGFGEKKTPEAFRNACHRFIFTEVLRQPDITGVQPVASATPPAVQQVQQPLAALHILQVPPFPEKFLREAMESSADDSGWTNLGTLGSYMQKVQPDFDTRLFGYKKLSDLVKARSELFLTEERAVSGSNYKAIYVRPRSDA
jgi:hypothetical protein